MQRCALYFGSFNPLHIGHITIAKYTILNKQIDEFKFVLSPQNPIKKDCGNSEVRLNNLKTIVRDINNNSFNFTLDSFMFKSKQEELNVFNILSSNISSEKKIELSDIEFHLPKPLLTYNTLKALAQIHPLKEFIMITVAEN